VTQSKPGSAQTSTTAEPHVHGRRTPRHSTARVPKPPVQAAVETAPDPQIAEPVGGQGSILLQHPAAAPVTITHEFVITGDAAEALWEAYRDNFEPLKSLAILRHFDTHEEVLDQLANPKIHKIVGWQEGRPVGLAMVTNSLEDVAEISPEFLRAKYPDYAARNAIYCGMLVMVSHALRGRTLFGRLYTELWQVPALEAGILVFDVCEFNRMMFDTDELTKRIASSFPRSAVEVLDRQTWYVAALPEPIPGSRPA
jgi:hypothetical protein